MSAKVVDSSGAISEQEYEEEEPLRETEKEPVWEMWRWMGTELSLSRRSNTGASGPRRGDSFGPDLRRRCRCSSWP